VTIDNGRVSTEPAGGAIDWDGRYAESDQIWSGQPNGGLVAEVESLAPGRALDVGCGEGADAVWLAQRGWQVTALDVSQVALDRASGAAAGAGVSVRWLHAGLEAALEGELHGEGFELVSAQYPALPSTPGHDAERALLGAVATGGVLLVVHHADMDEEHARAHGFNLEDFVSHDDVLALLAGLDGSWAVEVDERRPRFVEGGAGQGHTADLVLRARRLR
jgi:SAM-dependent methyltransferase